MWQRFTEPARRAIMFAQHEAARTNSKTVETEHILLGLLQDTDSTATKVLSGMDVTLEKVWKELAPTIIPMGDHFLTREELDDLGLLFHVDTELVRQIEAKLLHKLRAQGSETEPKLSPQAKHVLELAANEARQLCDQLGTSDIGSEHILLGLLRQTDGNAARILNGLGLTLEQTRKAIVEQANG